MSKIFKLKPDEIEDLAVGYGACIATDLITVSGHKVGYMYRDEPEGLTNGWVFMSGNETQEYMDNPDNVAMYDTNTIANCDQDIIQFIESPVGTECERDSEGVLKLVLS